MAVRTVWEAIAVASVDGFIAPHDGAAPDRASRGGWTSEEDKDVLRERIAESDAVVVGGKTWRQSGRFLKAAGASLIVVLSRGLTDLLDDKQVAKLSHRLGKPADKTWRATSPGAIADGLSGFNHVLVCGGAETYNAFAHRIDMWTIVTEPVLMGSGVKLFGHSPGYRRELDLIHSSRLNNRGTTRSLYMPRQRAR